MSIHKLNSHNWNNSQNTASPICIFPLFRPIYLWTNRIFRCLLNFSRSLGTFLHNTNIQIQSYVSLPVILVNTTKNFIHFDTHSHTRTHTSIGISRRTQKYEEVDKNERAKKKPLSSKVWVEYLRQTIHFGGLILRVNCLKTTVIKSHSRKISSLEPDP